MLNHLVGILTGIKLRDELVDLVRVIVMAVKAALEALTELTNASEVITKELLNQNSIKILRELLTGIDQLEGNVEQIWI